MALVVHSRLLLLNNEVNLKLVKKYSEEFQKEVVFINPDPVIADRVIRSGFKAFPDLNSLENNNPLHAVAVGKEENNDNPVDSNKQLKSVKRIEDVERIEDVDDRGEYGDKKHRVFNLVGVILILLLAWFYFMYPTAVVEVKPVVEQQQHEMELLGSLQLNNIDWSNHILPLHRFEVSITDEDEIYASGEKLIGETRAEGIVKFINENKNEIKIPAGTIVQTVSGIKFKTVKDVNVPGLKVDFLMDVPVGMKAGQAEVGIVALQKGSRGNIGIGRIKKMAKPLNKVYVINPEPTSGGKDRKLPVVTKNDINRLKESLEEKLQSSLLAKIYRKLGGNFRVIENEIDYSKIEFNFSHRVGDIVEVINGSGTLTASGYLLKNSELDRMVTVLFEENLEKDKRLLSNGISVTRVDLEEKGNGLYNIKIGFVAPVVPDIDTGNLIKALKGSKIDQARQVLSNSQIIDDFNIKTRGNILPKLGFAIKVVVKEPDFEVMPVSN
ncbi:hypothetical protein Hore_05790 [Halothermothrix orenii H 168]|uniref:Baseplate protein J-like barrel domain-containing protein n=2 Tax=Halothermothrix orenii TaxID=31909 RepID=B8D2A9_HALOH|nr:hypothetical protein Hore_05790 [Halothermothrix orenii H 168]